MSQIIKGDKKIEDSKQKNKEIKTSNCHENLGNNNYKKGDKIYTFNRDGTITITITNSDVFKNEQAKVSINNNNSLNNFRNNYKTNNYQYKNVYNRNTEYEINYNTPINNYTSHPYQDNNNYDDDDDDDDDYKKDFYHKFSDPWKVRNDVEKNGYTVSEFGEVFSPEQIKYYKKLGHDITPDSNFH